MLGGLLAALLLLGACTSTTGYRDVSYEELKDRSLLVIDASPTPNLPTGMHAAFEERFERSLQGSAHTGRVIGREQMHQQSARDAQLRADYRALSEVLSLMGVSERELTSRLGTGADVELIAMAQLFYQPCPLCTTGGLIGVTTSVVEAKSGRLLLRLHFSRRGDPENTEEVRAVVDDLTGLMLLNLTSAFEPKWHRLRFRNMQKPQSG